MTAIQQASDAKKGTQAVTTNWYGLGNDASMISSSHIQWDAAFTGVITFWTASFPEVALTSIVAGEWIQQNPPTGYTAISPAGAATAATPLVITVPGGTAGGCDVQFGNLGSMMLRAQVVCTVAGFLRIRAHGKQ
jgi:hypothetical protein